MWKALRFTICVLSVFGCAATVALWERSSRTMEAVIYLRGRASYGASSSKGVLEFSRREEEVNVELIRRGYDAASLASEFFRWRESFAPRVWFPELSRSFSWELEGKVLADGKPFTRVKVGFPHGLLLVVFAPGASWPLLHWLRQRRRVKRGRCVNCGYDLRASPERCPECGTPRGAVGNRKLNRKTVGHGDPTSRAVGHGDPTLQRRNGRTES